MRRLVLPVVLALCAFALTATIAQASYVVGISDQLAKTFTNPKYAPLKMKTAHYVAPYDVMTDPAQLQRFDEWIKAAKAAKQKVLVSFEHSRTPGKESKMPSIAEYTKQLKAIKAAYGSMITDVSPWNEVNVCQKGTRFEGQPKKICRDPKVAAAVLKAAKTVFKTNKLVVLDFLDGKNPSATLSYIRKFKKAAKPSKTAIWGLHNYSDTNRYSDKVQRTKKILKEIGKGEIWLTETGGQVTLGGRSVAEGAPLAAKALGCMFDIANRYKQIKRVYVFSFNGTPEGQGLLFDSGLVAADGVTERPGYAIVKKRKAIKCKK